MLYVRNIYKFSMEALYLGHGIIDAIKSVNIGGENAWRGTYIIHIFNK